MVKAVVFDLDGTLLDTGDGVVKSVKFTIEKMKLSSLSEEVLRTFVGPPIKNKLMSTYGLDETTAVKAMDIFRDHYGQEDIYCATKYDGIVDTLISLRENGYKVGVATYKRDDQAKKLLEKMDMSRFFDAIHGSDKEGKFTKADVVLNCIHNLGVEPEEVVMVGDSDNDAIGAEKAGASFLGVLYGYGFKSEDEIQMFPNIGIANDCQQISEIVINCCNK